MYTHTHTHTCRYVAISFKYCVCNEWCDACEEEEEETVSEFIQVSIGCSCQASVEMCRRTAVFLQVSSYACMIVFLQVTNYARVIVFLQRVIVFLQMHSYTSVLVFLEVSSYAHVIVFLQHTHAWLYFYRSLTTHVWLCLYNAWVAAHTWLIVFLQQASSYARVVDCISTGH